MARTKEELLSWLKTLGTASSAVFGGETGGYRLQQHCAELAGLLALIQERKINDYLEIGCAEGGLARVINDVFAPETIVVVDNNSNDSASHYRIDNLRGITYVEVIGNSILDRTTRLVKRQLVYGADLVVIDGHHASPYPMEDFARYGPVVRKGGVLVFHDTAHADGVKDVIIHIGAYYKREWKLIGVFHEGNIGLAAYERM